MFDKKDFNAIIKRINDFDNKREELIKNSRKLLKLSKRLIYAVHRSNLTEAKHLLKESKKQKSDIDKLIEKNKKLSLEGSYAEAVQEFVEAICYYNFVINKKISKISELNVRDEDYLAGICDLTGELTRRAVSLTVGKDFNGVKQIKAIVEQIYGEFLKLNLRNSMLRRKFDSIKWNLKKLEEIVYDIKIKK